MLRWNLKSSRIVSYFYLIYCVLVFHKWNFLFAWNISFFLSAVILYRNSWFPEVYVFPDSFCRAMRLMGFFPSYYLGDGICKIWCRYLWSSEDDKQPSHFPILFIGSLSLFHPQWECSEVRRHGRVVRAAHTWSPSLHVTFTLLSVVTEQWNISEQTHFITYIALNERTVETNNLSYSLKCTNHKLLIHYTEGY